MRKFVAAGCQCDVQDYSKNSITSVRKVGDTLTDLSEGHTMTGSYAATSLSMSRSRCRSWNGSAGTLPTRVYCMLRFPWRSGDAPAAGSAGNACLYPGFLALHAGTGRPSRGPCAAGCLSASHRKALSRNSCNRQTRYGCGCDQTPRLRRDRAPSESRTQGNALALRTYARERQGCDPIQNAASIHDKTLRMSGRSTR